LAVARDGAEERRRSFFFKWVWSEIRGILLPSVFTGVEVFGREEDFNGEAAGVVSLDSSGEPGGEPIGVLDTDDGTDVLMGMVPVMVTVMMR
jgi:hypothetical protein